MEEIAHEGLRVLHQSMRLQNARLLHILHRAPARTIQAEVAAAQEVGVNSTPTIFINDKKFLGALPYAEFQASINSFLK